MEPTSYRRSHGSTLAEPPSGYDSDTEHRTDEVAGRRFHQRPDVLLDGQRLHGGRVQHRHGGNVYYGCNFGGGMGGAESHEVISLVQRDLHEIAQEIHALTRAVNELCRQRGVRRHVRVVSEEEHDGLGSAAPRFKESEDEDSPRAGRDDLELQALRFRNASLQRQLQQMSMRHAFSDWRASARTSTAIHRLENENRQLRQQIHELEQAARRNKQALDAIHGHAQTTSEHLDPFLGLDDRRAFSAAVRNLDDEEEE